MEPSVLQKNSQNNSAADTLEHMRYMAEHKRSPNEVSAAALVAIAEQLALLNAHLANLRADVGLYVANH